jgi:Fe2+ or Zn2+ uptake regulation protein
MPSSSNAAQLRPAGLRVTQARLPVLAAVRAQPRGGTASAVEVDTVEATFRGRRPVSG